MVIPMVQSLQSESAIFANLKVPFSPLVECVCANPLSRGQSERGCTAAPRFPAIHVGRTWQWIDQAWNVSPDRYWVRRFCCHDTTATGSIAAYSPGNHCTATCVHIGGFACVLEWICVAHVAAGSYAGTVRTALASVPTCGVPVSRRRAESERRCSNASAFLIADLNVWQ